MKTYEQKSNSSFLGGLIKRAKGGADVVSPRLPSIYEPTSWNAVSVDMSTEEEPASVENTKQTSVQPREPAEKQIHDRDMQRKVATPMQALQVPSLDKEEHGMRETPGHTDSTAKIPAMSTVIETVRSVVDKRASVQAPESPDLHGRREDETPALVSQDKTAFKDVATYRDEQIATTPAHNAQIEQGQELPPLRRVEQGVIAERRAIPDTIREPLSSSANPETTPTINVTIGRLEIRASKERTEYRDKKPAPVGSQPMSLDDYMKQQWKGR